LTQTVGYQITAKLLDWKKPPTAIIGANDLTAFGAMRAVQEAGKQVGKDVAVAGFDGTEASEHSLPPLTTLHQPVYEIGRQVSKMLLKLILGEAEIPKNIELIPRLIIRESTLNNHNQPNEE
jgi:DNA-binding LacI/PurR family transcriptional regulator